MRIVAGTLGGRRLAAPPGRGTRPTSDKARGALFSRLGDVEGDRVLDLFAGSGALGLEALSRGAASCLFVDRDAAAAACVRGNVDALGVGDRAEVRRADAVRVVREEAAAGRRYDLVLLDPPYDRWPALGPLLAAELPRIVAPGARVAAEAPAGTPPPLDLPGDARRYGAAEVHVFHV